MLSAILHGKKTGTGFAGTRLKIGETQGAEDVLTSTVFERIAYLPNETFTQFIKCLFNEKEDTGYLKEIDFWLAWEWNSSFVEPDVLLTGSNGQSIIIEAKRYDYLQQQYAEQLAKELIAASQNGIANPILLTIGGMAEYNEKSLNHLRKQVEQELAKFSGTFSYKIYCVSWQDVYLALDKAVKHHKNEAFLLRLLNDIREAYEWHGIRHQPRQWLSGLSRYSLNNVAFPDIFKQEKNWKRLVPMNIERTKSPSFLGVKDE
ncbi:hypothetical protein [Actinobacillus equuli]|uniref:hypothetical protein n=1 Tax=Actinobacillus equuli TaxID=718 RepID=UPI0024430706|nr:hypothetical protein [Actinobacillus equuli]WGE57105.1 hypothetical protein NYR71_10400 [Actinobacillus equuli subsp. equuli]